MTKLDETHDPARQSWVESANGHPDFPVQNLPLGVFSVGKDSPRIGCAIGDMILDLKALAKAGLVDDDWRLALGLSTLNAWFARGWDDATRLRKRLSELLSDESHKPAVEPLLARACPAQKLAIRVLWKEADELNRIFSAIFRKTKTTATTSA